MELDWVVGQLLKKLDDLGIADNTIIVLTSDNGAQKFSWPDGGTEPFRGEKGTTWEGGISSTLRGSLARCNQAKHHHQRHRLARGLDAYFSRRS